MTLQLELFTLMVLIFARHHKKKFVQKLASFHKRPCCLRVRLQTIFALENKMQHRMKSNMRPVLRKRRSLLVKWKTALIQKSNKGVRTYQEDKNNDCRLRELLSENQIFIYLMIVSQLLISKQMLNFVQR